MQYFKSISSLDIPATVHLQAAASSGVSRGWRALRSRLSSEGRAWLSDTAVNTGRARLEKLLPKEFTFTFAKSLSSFYSKTVNAASSATPVTPPDHRVPLRLIKLLEKMELRQLPKATATIKAASDICPAWTKTTPVSHIVDSPRSNFPAVALCIASLVIFATLATVISRGNTGERKGKDPPDIVQVDDHGDDEMEEHALGVETSDSLTPFHSTFPTLVVFLYGLAMAFHRSRTWMSRWTTALTVGTTAYTIVLIFELILMILLWAVESQDPATSTFVSMLHLPWSLILSLVGELGIYGFVILNCLANLAASDRTRDEEEDNKDFIYVGISSPPWYKWYRSILNDTRCLYGDGAEDDDCKDFVYVGISSPLWFKWYHNILEMVNDTRCSITSWLGRSTGYDDSKDFVYIGISSPLRLRWYHNILEMVNDTRCSIGSWLCGSGEEEEDSNDFIYVGISSPLWLKWFHELLGIIHGTGYVTTSFLWGFAGMVAVLGLAWITPDMNNMCLGQNLGHSRVESVIESDDFGIDEIDDSSAPVTHHKDDSFSFDSGPGLSASIWAC